MNIDKELDELFSDPLLDIKEGETKLFDMPEDMRRVIKEKKRPDFVAQRKLCEDFDQFRSLFENVQKDLKEGKRSLIRISKTTNLQVGHFYIVAGQMLYLSEIGETKVSTNGLLDGRTRCIYDDGTESNILLQTLRKNVVGDGYAITETEEETNKSFFNESDIHQQDKVTGYIYVLKSLSDDPRIANQKNLYKIGFTTNKVEERVANAQNEPTYLMAPVQIVSSYKIVNMNSHKFETLLHQIIENVNFKITVNDEKGQPHEATEWYVIPLNIIDTIIKKIMDGSIVQYSYNQREECLERHIVKKKSRLDLSGYKVLTLIIKKVYYDAIIRGEKKEEYRELKQTTINKYTFIDETDGKRYLRRYDFLHLFVGYNKDRENAIVEVVDTTYEEGIVVYHLGRIIEVN